MSKISKGRNVKKQKTKKGAGGGGRGGGSNIKGGDRTPLSTMNESSYNVYEFSWKFRVQITLIFYKLAHQVLIFSYE